MNKKDSILGIVLAGGKSTRMGTDKALLDFGGKPLLQHAIELLVPMCDKVVISAGENQYILQDIEVWEDEKPVAASMMGIYSCMKRSVCDWNIILSCDMPLVSTSLLKHLLSFRNEAEIIVPVHPDGNLEPLCAVYQSSLVPRLEQAVKEEKFSMQQFILKGSYKAVLIDSSLSFYHPRLFINVNTRADLTNLQQIPPNSTLIK